MSELRNEDFAARRVPRPPAPAGHAAEEAGHASFAAGGSRGGEVAPRHIRGVLQAPAADGHGGRWAALTRWAAGIIFLIFGVAKFSDHAAELASFRHYPLPVPGAGLANSQSPAG
jgi:hypothetical protein